jgi:hypothetical protein|tara:strand:+ start:2393 stop:2599 length:207 start_codon:yes stop_codon:yes gene_type:complete
MKEEKLNKLWDLTVDQLIYRLESGEATSQDINVARQMLRDHGVNVEDVSETPIADLSRVLPFKTGTDN